MIETNRKKKGKGKGCRQEQGFVGKTGDLSR